MATLMTQYVMGHMGELRFQPTAKRIRVLADGETVADTTRAVLVWEPKRVTPQYAVPAADLRVKLMDGAEKAERRKPAGDGIGFDEGAIELLGLGRDHAVQADGIGHG